MSTVITTTAAGTNGFDKQSPLNSSQITTIWSNSPYSVAIDIATQTASKDQTYVQALLDEGFYVGFMRGYYSGMFDSNPSTVGAQHTQDCIAVANGFSGAAGMTLWCDLGGSTKNTTAQDIIDYANAFNKACQTAGYEGGVYVDDVGPLQLDGSQLYLDLTTSHYWRGCSSSIWPFVDAGQKTGWQILQTECTYDYKGITVDNDSIQTDAAGGNAVFIKKA